MEIGCAYMLGKGGSPGVRGGRGWVCSWYVVYIYGILKDFYISYISSKVTINLAFWWQFLNRYNFYVCHSYLQKNKTETL